ncbi:MAG: hypothetical protein LUG89_05555 [Methanosphaera sp.]|nr:hypothetical protein [Methanosphaera sp.]
MIIYPDSDTNMQLYEDFLPSETIVYDEENTINTKLEKSSDKNIFSDETVILFTHNCIVDADYDITPLTDACTNIKDVVREDCLFIIDSKVPPRTVYKLSKIIDGYDMIKDINMAYTTMITDDTRVIAATNEYSKDYITRLYEPLGDNIRVASNIQSAEAVCMLQSAYKDTLIALSNQLAILSEALTVDLIDSIDLANTSSDVNLLYPQPVLDCDTIRGSKEIMSLADEYGEASQLSETTRSTNDYVAYHIAYMAEKELYLKEHLAMFETTVAILGLTDDDKLVEDDNVSLTLVDDFVKRDVEVWVHDDAVSPDIIEKHGAKKITLDEAYNSDCIIIMADKPEYRAIDPERVEKVIITALPLLNTDAFSNKEYSSVGQYRLKKEEML